MTKDVSEQTPARSTWLERLARRRQESSFFLLAIGLICAGFTAFIFFKYHSAYLPLSLWGFCLTFIFLGAGIWHRFFQATRTLSEVDGARLMVLTVGGLSGLAT